MKNVFFTIFLILSSKILLSQMSLSLVTNLLFPDFASFSSLKNSYNQYHTEELSKKMKDFRYILGMRINSTLMFNFNEKFSLRGIALKR